MVQKKTILAPNAQGSAVTRPLSPREADGQSVPCLSSTRNPITGWPVGAPQSHNIFDHLFSTHPHCFVHFVCNLKF